jgi:dihydropyrimidine dehydrogenase (NAD+) subunit PreT
MTASETNDVKANRLSSADYIDNFSDIHPPLTPHEALVEADRCYFCYDAPCMTACPTSIDIPMFIRKIQAANPVGSAKTIFEQNIMGGMCARVCPTETLCEEVCVRETAEGKPVKIGLLQRYATDTFMEREQPHPFTRAAPTGKKIAVIGAGPAGLSCAHRLATHGHDVTVYEAREKAGGLNEYGIASYKTTNDFAQDEVDFILQIGGITIENGKALGRDITLDQLSADFDAVFLGVGLPGVNSLGLDNEDAAGIIDAVDFIAVLRQADDLSQLEIGRRVVVIGGGMTAIDAAMQSRLLGAEEVTVAYRRGQEHMNASLYEQELAQTHGVTIRHWMMPARLEVSNGAVKSITMEKTELDASGKLAGTGEMVTIQADQVFKAIGQTPDAAPLAGASIELEKGRIRVDEHRRTSHKRIWAGGDCVAGGEDLTVASVEDGKVAAESIHKALMA